TLRELRRVARRGHEVSMLHVLTRPEIEFDYRGPIEFEDLETGARRIVDAGPTGAGYRAAMATFVNEWRTSARRDGIDYARSLPPRSASRGSVAVVSPPAGVAGARRDGQLTGVR